jgi:hypothetical protein
VIVFLGHLALFALAYWVPGRLLLARLVPDPQPGETFPAAVALGIVAVSALAVLATGLLGLTTEVYLGPFGVLAASLVVAGVAAGTLGRAGLRRLWPALRRRPTRLQWGLLALTVGSTGFYAAHYDRDAFWEEACMVRATMAVRADTLRADLIALYDGGGPLSDYQSDPLKGKDPDHNNFLRYNQGQRMGPTLLLAPLVALFDATAFPLAYLLQGLLLPGLGFALGRRFLPRAWQAWAVAVALVFSPYGLATRTFDENLLCAPFGLVALLLLVRHRPAALAAGAAFSLFLAFREIALFALPFVALYLWRRHPTPRRALGAFALGVVACGVPTLVMHTLFVTVEGGTWLVQAFERPLVPHDLFGWRFDLDLLLNWPFWPTPLRSPYTAWAPLVGYPLDLLVRLGVVACGLLASGTVWLWRRDRVALVLLLGWFVGPVLPLLVQSDWIEPNKMGIPGSVFAPLALLLGAGLAGLADRARSWPRRLAPALVGLALPLALVPALRAVESPRDERVIAAPKTLWDKIFPPEITRQDEEVPEDADVERRRQRLSPLPRLLPDDFHPSMWAKGARAALTELGDRDFRAYHRAPLDVLQSIYLGSGLMIGPVSLFQATLQAADEPPRLVPWRFWQGPAPGPGGARTALLLLDLARPSFAEEPPLRLAAGPPAGRPPLDLTGAAVNRVEGLRVPWSPHPRTLVAARSQAGTVHVYLAAGAPGEFIETSPIDLRSADASGWGDAVVPLLVPRGEPIRLIEVRSVRPVRWIARTLYVDDDGELWVSEATPMSPT